MIWTFHTGFDLAIVYARQMETAEAQRILREIEHTEITGIVVAYEWNDLGYRTKSKLMSPKADFH